MREHGEVLAKRLVFAYPGCNGDASEWFCRHEEMLVAGEKAKAGIHELAARFRCTD